MRPGATRGAVALGAGRAVHDVLAVALVLAPAVVVDAAAHRGGAGGGTGADLVAVSAAVALGHLVLARVRRRRGRARAVPPADRATAALTGLTVLAAGASLLPAAVLSGSVGVPAGAMDAGTHTLALWGVVQLLAVGLAEGLHAFTLRWLTASTRPSTPTPPGRPSREPVRRR